MEFNLSSSSINVAFKRIIFLINQRDKIKCFVIILFALFNSCLEVMSASVVVLFAQALTNPDSIKKYFKYVGYENISQSKSILYVALTFGAVFLVKNLFSAFEAYHQHKTIQEMSYKFKSKLLKMYANIDYSLYLTRNSSSGFQTIEGDAERFFSTGMLSFGNILTELLVFVFLTITIVILNPELSLILIVIGCPVYFFVTRFFFPAFYEWGKSLRDLSVESHKNLLSFFHGFKEIILLGKSDFFVENYTSQSRIRSRIQAVRDATNTYPRLVLEIIFVFLFVSSVSFMVVSSNEPTHMIGTLAAYLYAGFRIMPGLNRLISLFNTLKTALPSIERVYLENKLLSSAENFLDNQSFLFEHKICFNEVSFRYLNTDSDILQKVSFEIKRGEKIGIVGETGSGKSTLVDLLLGLLKPSHGSVLIDNKFTVACLQWHKKIGYVPQSIYLLDDTIQNNILFGDTNPNIGKILKAINQAQLESFISKLPDGLNTVVGERGIRLSGGERQRIAVARALYREPEVLIFDEATSALDNETEARLIETINEIGLNRTVIMVAHRLETLRGCEKILKVSERMVKVFSGLQSI